MGDKLAFEIWYKPEESTAEPTTHQTYKPKKRLKDMGKRLLGSFNKKLGLTVLQEGPDFLESLDEADDTAEQPVTFCKSSVLDVDQNCTMDIQQSNCIIFDDLNTEVGKLRYRIVYIPFTKYIEVFDCLS